MLTEPLKMDSSAQNGWDGRIHWYQNKFIFLQMYGVYFYNIVTIWVLNIFPDIL